jgi:hypothetical protein
MMDKVTQALKDCNKNMFVNVLQKTEALVRHIIYANKKDLLDNGAELPNDCAIKNFFMTLNQLAQKDVYPDRVSPSIEGGMYACFKRDGHTMHMEMYNDGDMGCIVEGSVSNAVVANVDFETVDAMVGYVVGFLHDKK